MALSRLPLSKPLRLAAPYLAVAFFWCGLSSAWLAILAYHAQILLWSRRTHRPNLQPGRPSLDWTPALAALAGPGILFLLPMMARTDLASWLHMHGLTGRPFLLMLPYFAILHPILEQIHWHPLRQRTPLSHPLFAGYHLLVLHSLITPLWMAAAFLLLTAISCLWHKQASQTRSLLLPITTHILADSSIILAVWFYITRCGG